VTEAKPPIDFAKIFWISRYC